MVDENLREKIINELKQIILSELQNENVRVYLFGSWARYEEKQSSDIDIGIETIGEIPLTKWTNLYDRVEESTIPYKVDIVNLNEVNSNLAESVKKEGIIWKGYTNE